jgi:hypothetical protein
MSLAERAMAMAAQQPAPSPQAENPVENKQPEIPMAIHTKTATIAVYGHEYMGKREIDLLALALTNDAIGNNHGIRVVRFLADGRPTKADGTPIFAASNVELGGILINLNRHFDAAVETCEKHPNQSLWAVYNQQLIQSYLHEISHISCRQTEADRAAAAEGCPAEEEEASEKFSHETLLHLAKNYNVELGHYTQSSFFAEAVNRLFIDKENELAYSNDAVKKQKHMLENCLMYELVGTDISNTFCATTFKQFVQLLDSEGFDGDDWNKNEVANIDVAITDAVGPPQVAPPQAHGATLNTEFPYEDDMPFEYEEAMPQPQYTQQGVNTQLQTGIPAGGATTQTQAETIQHQPTGLTAEQTNEVVRGVYTKIYNHIFGVCQPLMNSDKGFGNPEAAATMPIQLTDIERRVIIRYDCQTPMGQWSPNQHTANSGVITGHFSKDGTLPMYTLYINNCGVEVARKLIPQNVNKRGYDGQLSKPALQARGGSRIMYICEGNKAAVQAGAKNFIMKFVDNQIVPC